VRTRLARDEEAERVAALWTEAYSGRHPEGRRQPYAAADYFEAAAAAEVWVAEGEGGEAGGPVAVVVLRPPGAPGSAVARAGEAELSRLAVSAAARRRGLGRALVELCGERARALGATAVALWSRPYQAEAHRLYAAAGYRRTPERDGRDADGERRTFVLPLTPRSHLERDRG
jgi:ribosomal protein S18 acetylase RimI-like enzyme